MNSSNTSQGNTPGPLSPYGPLSFSYNKKKSPSPGSAKRISLTSGMVRFGNDDEDDQNADDDSSHLHVVRDIMSELIKVVAK